MARRRKRSPSPITSMTNAKNELSELAALRRNRDMGCQDGTRAVGLRRAFCRSSLFTGAGKGGDKCWPSHQIEHGWSFCAPHRGQMSVTLGHLDGFVSEDVLEHVKITGAQDPRLHIEQPLQHSISPLEVLRRAFAEQPSQFFMQYLAVCFRRFELEKNRGRHT